MPKQSLTNSAISLSIQFNFLHKIIKQTVGDFNDQPKHTNLNIKLVHIF